jgi:hypothetical protein
MGIGMSRIGTIHKAIVEAGERGMTRHELAELLNIPVQSICGLVLELIGRRAIRADGRKRCRCSVLVAVSDVIPDKERGDFPEGVSRGSGIVHAHEAIACLKRIPKNDALRKRGFQVVTDWIRHNKNK